MDFMHTNDMACKLSYYLRYSGKLVSAWVTVTIVIERLIIVALPLKVSTCHNIHCTAFLPRDATHSAVLVIVNLSVRPSSCLSVRLSVTLLDYASMV